MDMSEGGKKEPLTSPAPAQSALGPSRSLQGQVDAVSHVLPVVAVLAYLSRRIAQEAGGSS
jgi:hypothetical protein